MFEALETTVRSLESGQGVFLWAYPSLAAAKLQLYRRQAKRFFIMTNETQSTEQTDGFHLVIDALKLNGITNIYGLPGIPVTDLTRMMQAAGMRVISFRHEQNAGNVSP
jgi:hypothetical protein